MKDPSKVTTQAPFLAPYPLQKTKSIQPKTWPPNTPGAPLAGEQVPGERWGLQPALDPGCVAAADALRPLRVENGETPAPGAGEGRVRSCRPRAQHSGCAAPRGPDPAPRRSLIHSHIRPFARGRVRLRSVFSLPRPRRPPVVGAEPSARPAASRPSAGWCGATPLPVTWPADRPMTGNSKPESHRPRVDALRLPGRARPGGLPASPRGCPRSRLSEGPRAPPLGASKRTV